MADESPRSPKSPKEAAFSDEAMTLQVQQWLDDWTYRFMSSSLGKSWNRQRVVAAALDILILNGCNLTPEERQTFPSLPEPQMLEGLVERMPEQFREGFEQFVLQMQTIMQMLTRVRRSLDGAADDPIATVIEEIDSTQLGQKVLQTAVVVASKEVANIQRCQATWVAASEKRLNRLQSSAELCERAQQQLLAVEAQLETLNGEKKSKSKSMLVNMAESNDKNLIHSCYSAWLGVTLKGRSEKALRQKFEAQIEDLERKLFEYKEKQLENVRNTMIRAAKEGTTGLLGTILTVWATETKARLRDGDSAAAVRAMEERLKGQKDEQAAKTKQALTRMVGNRDGMLVAMVFQGFVQYHNDYLKDKEMEDAVKRQEAAFKAHLEGDKAKKKELLNRVSAGSDTGLMSTVMKAWAEYFLNEKEEQRRADALNGPEGRFASLQSRQKANASGVQGRVNEQMKIILFLKCFSSWATEAKVESVKRYYSTKLDSKKKQLDGVQKLFKSFSQQLEAGLGNLDGGDSSGRGQPPRSHKHKSLNKNQDTVSLPDIRDRPVVA